MIWDDFVRGCGLSGWWAKKTLCVWVCFVVVMVGFDLLCTGSWITVLGPLLILFEVG